MSELNKLKPVQHFWLESADSEPRATELVANMDETISEETHVTTVVVDQGTEIENYFSAPNELALKNTMSDIKDFLAKDYIMTPYLWGNTAANTNLVGFDPCALFYTDPKYIYKLQGINLIKFNVEVTIKINAYAFQAGALLLHFLPCVGEFSSGWTTTRNLNLTTKTQHPSVEIDAHDSSVTLSVPYITPFEYYSINPRKYSVGYFYLDVLSPLTVGAGGAVNADVTMSVRFTDVELAAPMVANSEEVKMAKNNSISAGLMATSRVVRSLSSIPVLSSYVEPAAWALRTASGVAAAFGYSKPQTDANVIPVHQGNYRYMATSEGADDSIPLAVARDNKVAVITDGSITQEDEMSMRYLLSKSYYQTAYTWGAATTSIFNANVAPSTCYSSGSYASAGKTASYRTGGPLYYFSQFFSYWRGSLKLRLKFVKTQFHTGRILITWQPDYYTTTAPTDPTFCLRHYVDIREADEIELELPYLVPQAFLGQNDSSGRLSITVVNLLRAPETCASSIQVLMYWSAGSDFQFAGPIAGCVTPPLMIGNADSSFMAPSGKRVVRDVIGGEKVPRLTLQPNLLCMGEYISSVKQLLNRASYCGTTYTGTTVQVVPWFHGASTTSAGSITSTAPGGDTMSNIGLMYCFFRGSVRCFLGLTGSQGAAQLRRAGAGSAYMGAGQSSVPNTNWATPSSSTLGLFATAPTDSVNNVHSYLVPYYNDTRMSLLDFTVGSTIAGVDSSVPEVALNYESSSSVTTKLLRSAGEDWQLSYFIGCPPLLITFA